MALLLFILPSLSLTEDAPVLNITRFVVNDSIINPSTKIWKGDTIILSYNQNRLQFDLAALGLFNNNEYLYKYRLKGFDESWQHKEKVCLKMFFAAVILDYLM